MLLVLLTLNCLPAPQDGARLPAPRNLEVVTVSHGAIITWTVNREKGRPIAGYNIYLSEFPLESKFPRWHKDHPQPYNHTPFPGDTDGDITRESFEISGQENGRAYYVSVRTVGLGGVESKPSAEIAFTPIAKGRFTISENHSSDNGGFCFDLEISIPSRDPRCDIYLYSKGNTVGLSSPDRLGGGLRKTGFLKKGDKSGKYENTITVGRGDRISVKTKTGLAELTVKKINSGNSGTSALIDYVFYENKPPE